MTTNERSRPWPALSDQISKGATDHDVVILGRSGVTETTWARLFSEACSWSRTLEDAGVQRGDRVALLSPTEESLVLALEAVWLRAGTPFVLPTSLLRHDGALTSLHEARLRTAQPSTLIVDEAFRSDNVAVPRLLSMAELATKSMDHSALEPLPLPNEEHPESLALLQFTSGSTSSPKAVMISSRALASNVDAIANGLRLDPRADRILSWLPLYHDMGLIGMVVLAMTSGTPLVLADPSLYAREPAIWLRWITEYRPSIICAPGSAYNRASTALDSSVHDLSSIRIAINGSEPIHPLATRRFIESAAVCGFHERAMFCAYGLAEATLAVTFPPVGSGLLVDRRLPPEAADSTPFDLRERVVLGGAVQGTRVRVANGATPCPHRHVGEVQVAGASLMTGYFGNPVETSTAYSGGWLRTGDLGYLTEDGSLVLTGRARDVVIVNGINVSAEAVEEAVGSLNCPGVGRVVAFAVTQGDATERLGIAFEHLDGSAAAAESARAIRAGVAAQLGIVPSKVFPVPVGDIPRTTSGKVQRFAAAIRYQAHVGGTPSAPERDSSTQ